MRRVVVTGIGVVSAVGNTLEESWENTLAGKSGVARITLIDPSRLSVQIAAEVKDFNIDSWLDAKEARKTARFVQFAISATGQAIADSGLSIASVSERVGCNIGVGMGDIGEIERSSKILCEEKGPRRVSPFFVPTVIPNMAAGVAAKVFGLKGPNICCATACASGTHSIGDAYLMIKAGMADVMLSGGSESTVSEVCLSGFANMKALSKNNDQPEKASRPFDKNRDGFVLAEGSGMLVLEEYEHAKKRGARIYAEVVGYGASCDAYHITSPSPEGEGAQRCIRQALWSAGVEPSVVQYINAHGTSTYYNDLHETEAIKAVFGEHAKKVAISSTKGVTGHSLGAAGAIEAAFLAKSIYHQMAPPTANLETPDEQLDLDYIPLYKRAMPIEYALSNSFGFGGTNGCLLFKRV